MLRNIGAPEIIIVLVVVVLLFGARKLPELARSIGASAKELRAGMAEGAEDDNSDGDTEGQPGDDSSSEESSPDTSS
jgi:sec-independent protein translocase protein TatA